MQSLPCYLTHHNLPTKQTRFTRLSDTILNRIDDMGSKIDDLEKSIADLMDQAGVEPGDVSAAAKPKA